MTITTQKKNLHTDVETFIILKDEEKVFHNPRRLPLAEIRIVEEQLQVWLEEEIISPSRSEDASPIILVKKKDGSNRLCVDYRRLNKKILKDRYPFPNIEEQLDKLQAAKLYSTLDLENGFFHVPVEKSSRKYTAFCTHKCVFEFNKTPFGLCNSPSARFINHVFSHLLNQDILVLYMDDIIIPSVSYDEGLSRLDIVLNTASKNGLNIKWKKCQFLQRKVEYLGYIIENGTVKPSENKLNAVAKFPVPKSVKDVESFLGLTGYFRKLIPNYANRSSPLSDMYVT